MSHTQSNNTVPVIKSQDLNFTVLSSQRETADIVSFELSVNCENGKAFRHYPGQAVAIGLPVNGEQVFRTFTIASAMPEQSKITLTVKAGAQAQATAYMHREVKPGDRLKGRGPFGSFSVAHHPAKPLLLIGAGSGITPMLSCLRWLDKRAEVATDVVCLQQASTPEDLLCRDELLTMKARLPKFAYFDWVSSPQGRVSWSGFEGRISRQALLAAVPDAAQRRVLCCGPHAFTESIRQIYAELGGHKDNFLTESFGKEALDKTLAAEEDSTAVKEVVIELDGKRFSAASNESIKEAAARSGVVVPSACGVGACGTCKLKVLQGDTRMQHSGGLSEKEENAGFILGCSTMARSDLILKSSGYNS